ncbi:MAG: hypothetical protein HOH89_06625, partial [Alphaproteobacteria bacterium]|nr:hypothetical protein [Alphaproteobacteria bacterium]
MVVIAAAVGAAELILWALVWLFRPNFQWLIRPADETPDFPDDLIEKYVRLSFDKDLGWARRPGTTGIEQTEMGETTFLIDETGCRENPGWTGQSSDVAVFGDSFAFCRLVNDDETWPHALSKLLNTNVRNFGVVGLDSATGTELWRLRVDAREYERDIVCGEGRMAFLPGGSPFRRGVIYDLYTCRRLAQFEL